MLTVCSPALNTNTNVISIQTKACRTMCGLITGCEFIKNNNGEHSVLQLLCVTSKSGFHTHRNSWTIKQQAFKTLNTPESLLKAACKPPKSCLLKLSPTLLFLFSSALHAVPLPPPFISHSLNLSVLLSLLAILSSSLSLHPYFSHLSLFSVSVTLELVSNELCMRVCAFKIVSVFIVCCEVEANDRVISDDVWAIITCSL